MSLRSVGNQLLVTPPNTLLDAASTASFSLWIRINAGNNVANPNGVRIFGDSGGKLSATLFGTSSLVLGWLSHNGTINNNSNYNFALTPETNYHLASTWQNGVQNYYLNGDMVHSDSQMGTIGTLNDVAGHPYRIGSDSLGTDVTMDTPAIWVGYALSPKNVLNLRDRVVSPQQVAPTSLALAWTLLSQTSVAASIGDPGLTDQSMTQLNLASIVGTAPTYLLGDLAYDPPLKASVAPSGQSIVLQIEDSSGNPLDITAIAPPNDQQSIAFPNCPNGQAFVLNYEGQITAPIAVTVNPPDVYALWTIPTTAGHRYSIATTYPNLGSSGALLQVYEILNSAQVTLTTSNQSLKNNPSEFTDGTFGNGNPVYWNTIGTVVADGSHLYVRASSTPDSGFVVDAIRVHDTTNGAITYLDDQDGSMSVVPPGPNYSYTQSGNPNYFQGGITGISGTFYYPYPYPGPIYRSSVVEIQAKLSALSSVANGLTVSASNGVGDGPYLITSGDQIAHNAITCPDPNVLITHTVLGGHAPSYSLNGGASVPLLIDPINGRFPFAVYYLPQSSPASIVIPVGQGNFLSSGFNGVYGTSATTSLSGCPEYFDTASGPAGSYTIPFESLPAGTYQLSATWQTINSFQSGLSPLSTHAVFEVVDRSGGVLATVPVDQTVAPSDFSAGGFSWKILGSFTISPGSSNTQLKIVLTATGSTGTIILDGGRLDRTSSNLSVNILPSDVVTVSVPPNCIYTANGAVTPISNVLATNQVGGSLLPPFVNAPKTLRGGYNMEPESVLYNPGIRYTNLAHRLNTPMNGAISSDSNGYPTKINAPAIGGLTMGYPISPTGEKGKGHSSFPNGLYTFLWDWDGVNPASNLICRPAYTTGTATEVLSYQNLSGTTNNCRVYHLQGTATQYSPELTIQINGTAQDPADGNYWVSLKNLRVYPPNTILDPTGMTPWGVTDTPPKYHPNFFTHLGAVDTIRFLDELNTNNNAIANFSDFKPRTSLSYSSATSLTTSNIVSISAPTVPINGPGSLFWDTNLSLVIEVTTATPHNFSDGMLAYFSGITDQLQTTNAAGTSNGSFNINYYNLHVHVLSPTKLLVQSASYPADQVRMTNTITGGTVTCSRGSFAPLEDIVEICNLANNNLGANLWLNVPTVATLACVNSMADYIASNLKPGRKVYVEYSNECWNFATTQGWASLLTHIYDNYATDTDDYTVGYVSQAKLFHSAVLSRFTLAGRSGDVVRVMGSSAGDSGTTQRILNQCAIQGATFDALTVGSYMDNQISGDRTRSTVVTDLATIGQCLDTWEMVLGYSHYYDETIKAHKDLLISNGLPNVQLVNYEGSLGAPLPTSSLYSTSDNGFYRSGGCLRHPRIYNIMLAGYYQRLQDLGVTLSNIFFFSGTIAGQGGMDVGWSTWFGWNQQPGTGDPIADAININDFQALDQVKSQTGGAIQHWFSLVPAIIPTPVPKPKPLIPPRNGQPRATNTPHRLFRSV